MPRVGLAPLTETQLVALRALVDRGEVGIHPVEAEALANSRATLRAIERRGFAVYKCDRKPTGEPLFGTWRYVATPAGVLESQRSAVPQ